FCVNNFGRCEVILDVQHATEYLGDLAEAAYGQDEAPRNKAFEEWQRLLHEEGGAATVAVLREWEWPAKLGPGFQEVWVEVERYFSNHCHRMEYPEYTAEGWYIGSGAVESGCKVVVGQRLKLAGMRWGGEGADTTCAVRALYLSEDDAWEAFWQRR